MKKENHAIVITSIISGVVLLIAIMALTMFNPSSAYKDTLTVNGVSTIKALPDLVSVYFTIQTNGSTSSEANEANSEIYDDLVDALVDLGFEKSKINTESFNIYPNIEWNDGERTEKGYVAYHSVKIQIPTDETDKLSSAIDAGVEAGAGISYVNFELTPESQSLYKAQALELAAKDARIKAESVANGFGKNVGALVSVSVSDFGYYPWTLYSAASGGYDSDEVAVAKETVANIQPSEQEISASVSATYRIR